jgi:hypothetical protein
MNELIADFRLPILQSAAVTKLEIGNRQLEIRL